MVRICSLSFWANALGENMADTIARHAITRDENAKIRCMSEAPLAWFTNLTAQPAPRRRSRPLTGPSEHPQFGLSLAPRDATGRAMVKPAAAEDVGTTASETYGFGALVRQYRLAASLSQEVLGDRAGLSVATIAAVERGRSNVPRPGTVLLLAEALGLTPHERAALIAAATRASKAKGVRPEPMPV